MKFRICILLCFPIILSSYKVKSDKHILSQQLKPLILSKFGIEKILKIGEFKRVGLYKHHGKRGNISSMYSERFIKIGKFDLYIKENVMFLDYFKVKKFNKNSIMDLRIYRLRKFRDGFRRLQMNLYISKKYSKLIVIIDNSKYLNKVLCFELVK